MTEPILHVALPSCMNSEKAILSSIIQDPKLLDEPIPSDYFHHPAHKTIFKTLLEMHKEKLPIDCITLTSYLRNKKLLNTIGGVEQITLISTFVPTPLNYDFYRNNLKFQYAKKTAVIELCAANEAIPATQTLQDLYNVSTGALNAIKKVCEEDKQEESRDDFMLKYLETVEKRSKGQDTIDCIPTPFPLMNGRAVGLRPGKMTVIIGEKGAGKSILGNQIVCDSAFELGKTGAIFSLEMPKDECMDRAVSYQGKINLTRLMHGKMNKGEMERFPDAMNKVAKHNLHFYDSFGSETAIGNKCRELKRKHNLHIAMIDYLQLLDASGNGKDKRRDQDLTHLSTFFKRLAMELGIHVIIIAAATQGKDGNSWIRESKGCEFDADTIWKIRMNDAEKADKIFVDKWRGAEAKYSVPIEPHFEYCRIIQAPLP